MEMATIFVRLQWTGDHYLQPTTFILALVPSEVLVSIYQTTQYSPKDSHLYTCHCENLKSHLVHNSSFLAISGCS
jgi:hypothetical protein